MKFAKRYDVYADKIHVGTIDGFVVSGVTDKGNPFSYIRYHIIFPDGTKKEYDHSLDDFSVCTALDELLYKAERIDETFEIKLVPANQETTLDVAVNDN